MGVLCRKWHKTTLQKDKGVLGREENWQFVFRKQLSVSKGNFLIHEGHGGWWPSASLYPSFPYLSYKEISTDVCCVGLLGVQRVWEMGVSCLVDVLLFTNMLDLRLREQEHFCRMLLAPREIRKAGDVLGTSCPERFSHQKGPDGVSSGFSQLITCFCFHLCSPVGDWGLLLSNNVGYCLGRDTCALMETVWFKQLSRFSQW